MRRFGFLGTSGAVPSAERDTISLVFEDDAGLVLLDCGGSPVQRLRRLGLDPLRLTQVVLTHLHPDHAYGLPALLQCLMLLGRSASLPVVCRPEYVEPLQTLLDVFKLGGPRMGFAAPLTPIDLAPGARAFRVGALSVSTAPNEHGSMPNFAVRVDVDGGGAVVYSSDTQPCEAVVALSRGADTLIHEATFPQRHRGRFGVHSTAAEAGEIAARAGVRRLILAHVEADYHGELETLADEARKHFGGVVDVARELALYPL
jgi:ribonuclease Z